MAYLSFDDDPNVPEGAVLVAEVTVSQYLRPDGSLGVRTHYDGSLPMSSVLGWAAHVAWAALNASPVPPSPEEAEDG